MPIPKIPLPGSPKGSYPWPRGDRRHEPPVAIDEASMGTILSSANHVAPPATVKELYDLVANTAREFNPDLISTSERHLSNMFGRKLIDRLACLGYLVIVAEKA